MNAVAWTLLATSLVVLAWTYLGYPAWLALLSRWRARPTTTSPWEPSVTVCIAVHNGIAHLDAKLDGLLQHDYPAEKLDIVIVDDASTDGTKERLRERTDARVTVIEGRRRRGKTASLADAIRRARGEVLVFTDVRQALAAGSVRALCEALAEGELAAVSGRLVFRDAHGHPQSVEAYWRYETAIRRMEAATGSVIGVTGAIYAVRRSAMPEPPAGLVLDDVWVPMAIARNGGRIGLAEGAVAYDTASATSRAEASRKRRTLAGNWQLIAGWPHLLLPWRHPLAWRFIHHKVLRLVAPLFLLSALGANVALWGEGAVAQGLLWGQGLGYGLAFVGLLLPFLRRVLPIRLASAFLEMNLYAVLGVVDFLRGRDTPLWTPSATTDRKEQSAP